jgi:hypothetical protein
VGKRQRALVQVLADRAELLKSILVHLHPPKSVRFKAADRHSVPYRLAKTRKS